MQKYILVQMTRNSRKATNLASKCNLARTAIFIFMKPDDPVWKLPNVCPITSLTPTWKIIVWPQHGECLRCGMKCFFLFRVFLGVYLILF